MKRMNKDGVLLCELQATAFEKSIDKMESSSEIFIRRFMRSRIAKRLDDGSVLESNIQAEDILQLVNEEYGFSNYGSVKYTRNEMYWIGYIYRYFVITYELTSMQVYKIVKPKELKGLFLPYHTMGKAKYESLGLEYPLGDTPPAEKELAVWAKDIIMNGLKDRLRKH